MAGWNILTIAASALALVLAIDAAVISNEHRMRDIHGLEIDSHMQDIHRFAPEGPWYLYSMQFGLCLDTTCCDEGCGCRTDVNLTVYTSPDMSDGSWVLRSAVSVAPSQRPPNATFGRPKVLYNAATKRYVLWVNWFPFVDGQPAFMSSAYQTFTSDSPEGPFVSAVINVPTLHSAGGDLGLFVDSDGQGYVIYTSIEIGHRPSIERLSPDFTNTTQQNSGLLPFPAGCYESPLLFARGSDIFALAAPCCCNCVEGSTVQALRSTSGIFGPYLPAGATAGSTQLNNLNQSQQGTVVPITRNDGNTEYLWLGDRWKSAPDHRKGHDLTVFTLLNFTNGGANIAELVWSSTVTI